MAGGETDGYLRLIPGRGATPGLDLRPTKPGALTFVDVDIDVLPSKTPDTWNAERILGGFAQLQRRMTDTDVLVLRWPRVMGPVDGDEPASTDPEGDEEPRAWIDEIAASKGEVAMSQSHTGALVTRIGQQPEIIWANGDAPPDRVLLDLPRRARAAELLGMLRRGNAIWQPRTYHYRLPSGAHDTVFVRIADGFRSIRDFTALATWLTRHPSAARDGVGMLVDTGTLAPIAAAFQHLLRENRIRPGPVVTIDEYPRTRLEVRRLARIAAEGGNAIIGLLSVSSSGSVQAIMLDALEHASPPAWTLDTLVDRQSLLATTQEAPATATWLARGEMGVGELPGNRCRPCESNEQARLVQIHPRSFESLTLAEPELRMPDVISARDNAGWWTLVAAERATGVECRPHESSTISRARGERMPVRIFLDRALGSQRAGTVIQGRLKTLASAQAREHELVARALERMRGADTFLTTDDDYSLMRQHVDVFRDGLRATNARLVTESELEEGGRAAVGDKVVVLLGGTVTGTTATRLRVKLADDGEPDLHGLAVHARPTGPREWHSIRNTFSRGLVALWLTYLPARSPLSEEAEALTQWDDSTLSEAERRFVTQRITYSSEGDDPGLGDPDAHPVGLLWGQAPGGQGQWNLRGYPLYGTRLDPLTYYAAIGAALQNSLLTRAAKAAPEWLMFDMPAIFRSYFDGPLVACILRWAEPGRIWWGGNPSDARRAMEALLARTQPHKQDMLVLLPELLLAAAQGKVERAARQVLISVLDEVTHDWSGEERVPVDVGRKLVAYAHS